MPHLVILYSGNLDADTDMRSLCRQLADAMIGLRDEAGEPVFPVGGTRVLAYPAAHWAIADGGAAGRAAGGDGDYAFAYFNVRMARGRSDAVKRAVGEAITAVAKGHFAPLLAQRHVGLTLQVDEGHDVYDAKVSSLHPLFVVR
jgi:5-carboxymethyl-2-hydroxymuconate isomerase